MTTACNRISTALFVRRFPLRTTNILPKEVAWLPRGGLVRFTIQTASYPKTFDYIFLMSIKDGFASYLVTARRAFALPYRGGRGTISQPRRTPASGWSYRLAGSREQPLEAPFCCVVSAALPGRCLHAAIINVLYSASLESRYTFDTRGVG